MSSLDVVVVLRPASRELRRRLRPIEWVVLEDVALDARADDHGVVVASTSARAVAEHLGLTPGAAARALAGLRAAGLVTHARQAGPAGRFGLSAYVLAPVPGLAIIDADDAPGVARPRAVPPPIESPRVAERHMADDGAVSGPSGRSGAGGPAIAESDPAVDAPGPGGPTPTSAPRRASAPRPSSAAAQLTLLDAPNHPGPKARP